MQMMQFGLKISLYVKLFDLLLRKEMNNHQFDYYYFHNGINSYSAAILLLKMNSNIVLGILNEDFVIIRNTVF